MNLTHLEYFRAVARMGSATKAAEHLHVTQPTISNGLKSLENELGVQLFKRQGRSLVLNATGTEFLKSVNSIFGLLGSKKQLSVVTGIENCKEITIGSMRSESQLFDAIKKFQAMHPDVLFRMVSRSRLEANRDGELSDFMISPYHANLAKRHKCVIFESEQFILLPKDHRFADNEVVDVRKLSPETQILCTTPDVIIPHALSSCMQAGLTPNVRYIADDRFSTLVMLFRGAGIMFMPKDDALVVEELSAGQIVARPLCSDSLPEAWRTPVYLSWANTNELSAHAREFLVFLMDELGLEEI